ncbi:PRC-barrel domain-containing protein [Rhodococcus sp. DMU1]|uniref:PRC-barrel domain-containing protein n=1 Tax=Rhodococcus sp. DMU1 TaxID=2722825 RepID=UPI00143ECF3B|nr:PRC-barrel domain-containing protein [Rhodococcus sp. DMU1]QIX53947.1 PRC-barrel domain containing protein [Rhodococcus sp. DMU1]
MAAQNPPVQPTLIDLDDTDLTLVDPADDIRGRAVYDRDGDKIGTVDGLLVDEQRNTVRLLRIGSGGFLGLGKTDRLVPVDAVARIDPDAVHLDRTRGHVAGSSPYDPELAHASQYYADLYGYYGYRPFWGPGDIPPPVSPHIR